MGKGGLHAFGIDEADLPEHLASAFPGGRVARAVGPESLDNLGPNSQEGFNEVIGPGRPSRLRHP